MAASRFSPIQRNAYNTIGNNLAIIADEFGPLDFPDDGGFRFRNDLFSFVDSFFVWMIDLLDEGSDDPWTEMNRSNVMNADSEAFIRITESAHFYTRSWVFHRSQMSAAHKVVHITLDWLTNTYRGDPERAKEWFRVAVSSGDDERCIAAADEMFFSEVVSILNLDCRTSRNSESWTGLTLAAEVQANELRLPGARRDKWDTFCRDSFKDGTS